MLNIDVEPSGRGEAVLAVRGELDCATAPHLRQAITAIINRGDINVIGLDLRELGFIDSVGIGTLVVAQRICTEMGVRLKLAAVGAFAARLLGLAGMADSLGVQEEAEAVSASVSS